jgi:hypothetical protein
MCVYGRHVSNGSFALHSASTACRFCGQGSWEATFGRLPRAQPTVKVLQTLKSYNASKQQLVGLHASFPMRTHACAWRSAHVQVEFGNRSAAHVAVAPGPRGMQDFQVRLGTTALWTTAL